MEVDDGYNAQVHYEGPPRVVLSGPGGMHRIPHEEPAITGGERSFTQWVHCEFVVSFEAIRPVITQQVCGEFF